MSGIPALGFSAYSGTGKTTFLTEIIRLLKEKGLKIGVIKHAGRIDLDDGKDSSRFFRSGADSVMVISHGITMTVSCADTSFEEAALSFPNADLILVEGYRDEPISQIGMCRAATGKGFPDQIERYIAIITDLPIHTDLPCFGFSDTEAVARFIVENMGSFSKLGTAAQAGRDKTGMPK